MINIGHRVRLKSFSGESMKKDKHITINLDNDIYSLLERLAKHEKRTITNEAYLLLEKALINEVLPEEKK